MQVRDIEDLPAELQALALIRQLPPLGERHIQPGVAIPAYHIPRSALTGERMSKVVIEGVRGVGEHADSSLCISVMSKLWPCHHVCDTLLIPVRRPEVTVIHRERETAGPASQA